MNGIAVTLLTEDKERLTVLQQRLESTHMGRNVFGHVGFPASATDSVLRQVQDVRSEVVLVDIDPENVQRAMSTIELIHSNTSEIVIFAVGPMNDPGKQSMTFFPAICRALLTSGVWTRSPKACCS